MHCRTRQHTATNHQDHDHGQDDSSAFMSVFWSAVFLPFDVVSTSTLTTTVELK